MQHSRCIAPQTQVPQRSGLFRTQALGLLHPEGSRGAGIPAGDQSTVTARGGQGQTWEWAAGAPSVLVPPRVTNPTTCAFWCPGTFKEAQLSG